MPREKEKKNLKWISYVILEPGKEIELPSLSESQASELVELFNQHSLASRAYRILKSSSHFDSLPSPAKDSLKRSYLLANYNLENYTSLLQELESDFSPHHFRVLKGIRLCQTIYAVPSDRLFSDLDLLFSSSLESQIVELLRRKNFEEINTSYRFSANQHKREFLHSLDSRLKIELHFGLGIGFWPEIEDNFSQPPSKKSLSSWEVEFLVYHAAIQHRFQKAVWLVDLFLIEELLPTVQFYKNPIDFLRARDMVLNWRVNLENFLIHDQKLDSTLKNILLGAFEDGSWKVGLLRKELMGGWKNLLVYSAQRTLARLRSQKKDQIESPYS